MPEEQKSPVQIRLDVYQELLAWLRRQNAPRRWALPDRPFVLTLMHKLEEPFSAAAPLDSILLRVGGPVFVPVRAEHGRADPDPVAFLCGRFSGLQPGLERATAACETANRCRRSLEKAVARRARTSQRAADPAHGGRGVGRAGQCFRLPAVGAPSQITDSGLALR